MGWFNFGKKSYAIKAKTGTIDRVGTEYHVNLSGEPVSVNFYYSLKDKEEMYVELFGKTPDKYNLYNKHFPPKKDEEPVIDPSKITTLKPENYKEVKKRLDEADSYYPKILDEEIVSELIKKKVTIVFK